MSYAAVKLTGGGSLIASNTVKNTAGSPVVVSNDVLDTGAGVHTIFSTTVVVAPVKIVNFRLADANNRVFRL